jgi:hypothetical protein
MPEVNPAMLPSLARLAKAVLPGHSQVPGHPGYRTTLLSPPRPATTVGALEIFKDQHCIISSLQGEPWPALKSTPRGLALKNRSYWSCRRRISLLMETNMPFHTDIGTLGRLIARRSGMRVRGREQ